MLSVVIPSHRRADLLRFCLVSVERHAPPGTQVIVVDDGSPGGIVAAAAAAFRGVTVVRRPVAGGFAVAANAGLAVATGDVVEMLNDDAEVTAGWADAAIRWFADPAVGAVAPLVLQHGTPLIDSAGDEYDPGGFARKRGHGRPASSAPPAGPVWGVSAAAGFYRRLALVAVGGFAEAFGAYFEDVDLSFRLRRAGWAAWYDPASVVRHRVSASYGRRPTRRLVEQQSRNEERVFLRHVGRPHLPRHVAVLAAKAARRLGEGTLGPWLTGRIRAWTETE
jgi:GT2 family glycosyltransferase